MIVEPDFLSHWKTSMLIDELEDKAAPLYVISLWAHCEHRRSEDLSRLKPENIKEICHYPGDAEYFFKTLAEVGFIDVCGDRVVSHDWEKTNTYILRSNPNRSENLKQRGSLEYKKWRGRVLERDQSCRHCGTTTTLHAHHIKPFSKFIELRFSVENGIALCRRCHIQEHTKNRRKNNGW